MATLSNQEGTLSDVVDFMVTAVMDHINAHRARYESIQAMTDKSAAETAMRAFLLEAEAAFDEKMRKRFAGGGPIYGKRDVKLTAREHAIAEALQVRPALSMTQVFKRAGVSRSAGYRILDRLTKTMT